MVLKKVTKKARRENRPIPADQGWNDFWIVRKLKHYTISGFQGHSIYDVGRHFFKALFREEFTLRATSLAFNLFLALFPALLFLFTLIAYIPVRGLRYRLIRELDFFLPDSSFQAISATINDIIANQNGSLLSFGFLLAIWFSSNGFHTLINTFNRRLPRKRKRNWFQNRLIAMGLTVLIALMLIAAVIIIVYAGYLQTWIYKHKFVNRSTLRFLISSTEYLVLTALVFLVISCLYRFGPATVKKWRFASAGSITATLLCMVSSALFSVYVNNFGSYNKIYGSIGAIMALMVLLYMNVLGIIAGFELNSSIERASMAGETDSTEEL